MVFKIARKHLCIPYVLFLLLFVIAPVIVILYYAFTNGEGQFTVANFLGFFTSGNTVGTLLYSLFIALIVTCVCVLLAYPVAYILSKMMGRKRSTCSYCLLFLCGLILHSDLQHLKRC